MGATSVTGVGPGSAEGLAKGPRERNFVGVEKLIGPHVIGAGQVDLVGSAATVTFRDPLPGFTPDSVANNTPENDYVIFTYAATRPTITVNTSDEDGDGNDDHVEGFTIAGSGTETVFWMVANVGWGA